ncbi:hypothetical protein GCM10007164_11800 [Luteimonas padinae]|nr:hypothetical protein GCM10007164_11800 [Luteimonas padinae]
MIDAPARPPTVAGMTSEQEKFGLRLREALRAAKLPESAAELARLVPQYGGIPVTAAAAHRWLAGRSIPRAENMRALATLLRVRLDWLYGEEEGGRRVQDPRGKWDASAMDRHAIDAFLALDERHRKLVRELVAALAAVPRG